MNQSPCKLTDRQFRQYRDIAYNTCGITLNADKKELLNARLGRRLRRLGVTADEYLELVRSDGEELMQFVDAISTNHTFFFRESHVFRIINDHCQSIWCAAASSGEEPYSLAAYCHSRGIRASILATDISGSCLARGRRGVYAIESSKYIPAPILKQCFQKGRNHCSGFMRIKPEIKKAVQFRRLNLLNDPVPDVKFDIIFCRNVMIYFDNVTREKIVNKLCQALISGGHFIIGGAESLNGISHTLKYMAPSIYRRP